MCVCVCVCVDDKRERREKGKGRGKKRKRGIFFHLLQIEWSCDPSTEYPLLWAANDEREGHVRVSEEDGKKNLKQRLLPCKASLRPPLFDFCNDWTFFQGRWFSEHVKQNNGLMCTLEPIRASVSKDLNHKKIIILLLGDYSRFVHSYQRFAHYCSGTVLIYI